MESAQFDAYKKKHVRHNMSHMENGHFEKYLPVRFYIWPVVLFGRYWNVANQTTLY